MCPQALQPRPAHQAPLFPPVTLMFISPSKLDSLYSKLDLDLVDATISLFCAVVRSVLTGTGCYECQEFEGRWWCHRCCRPDGVVVSRGPTTKVTGGCSLCSRLWTDAVADGA